MNIIYKGKRLYCQHKCLCIVNFYWCILKRKLSDLKRAIDSSHYSFPVFLIILSVTGEDKRAIVRAY